jgi:hypothetical protein
MKRAPNAWIVLAVLIACGGSGEESKFGDPSGDTTSGGTSSGGSGGLGSNTDAGSELPLPNVEAVVTTDNAFSFGYGDGQKLNTFIQGAPSSSAPEIFNCPVDFGPEPFVVPGAQAPAGAFLYIIAWADTNVTQGTLAQFKRGGQVIYSGHGSWQVCATGKFYEGHSNGPDQATVNEYIGVCNKGAAGTAYSKGWVTTAGALTSGALGRLAFGEANDSADGPFPIVCQTDDAGVRGIDPGARWMWYDPQDGQSAFVGNVNNRTKTFLIFRLPAEALAEIR